MIWGKGKETKIEVHGLLKSASLWVGWEGDRVIHERVRRSFHGDVTSQAEPQSLLGAIPRRQNCSLKT